MMNKAIAIAKLLGNASTTFAGIAYSTTVPTAAKFKHLHITKSTKANVQLFSTIGEFTNVYENAVKKRAEKLGITPQTAIDNFKSQGNYFNHTACYSLVEHNTTKKMYLYAIYNNANSIYFINGVETTKQNILQYMTPSAAKAMTANTHTTGDVEHDVTVRTIALDNLQSITANKQTLTF